MMQVQQNSTTQYSIAYTQVHIVDKNRQNEMEMDFTPKGQIQVCTNVGHAIDAMALLSLGWPKIQILIIMSVDQQSFTTYRYFVNIVNIKKGL